MTHKDEYVAPWEKAFKSVLTPIEVFIHRQTTSGILLMICAVIAIIIANTQWIETYNHILQTKVKLGLGDNVFSMSVHHWINDGLMALFFLLVGLELKRELLVGELSNLKAAMLPLVAAIGGMVVPALIYYNFNPTGYTANGWAIPMATDIAFALGVLALLGNRVPTALLTFLVALAIVDDLGAVMVIAIFYTEQLNYPALVGAALTIGALIALKLGGVRKIAPYILFGFILWLFLLKSGVHATLAGVFLAFIIPIRPKYDPNKFLEGAKELLSKISEIYKSEPNIIKNYKMRASVRSLEKGLHNVQAPAQILEYNLHIPIAFVIIPIFALANAGVPIEFSNLGSSIMHPVSLGVIGGLVFGKLIGVAGFVWMAVKLGICSLPKELNMNHIIGVSFLAGIGFTMSIFIAELGFAGSPEDLILAKTGILIASLIAGITGYLWLYINSYNNKLSITEQ